MTLDIDVGGANASPKPTAMQTTAAIRCRRDDILKVLVYGVELNYDAFNEYG